MKTRILHLAVDFNTPHRARTTPAIEWFVDELGDYDNVVIALRRTVNPLALQIRECSVPGGPRVFDMPYFGLPLGVGLLRGMRRAARRINALLEGEGVRPCLVHAHKFAFEGLAGLIVARHFAVPLFVSLRGEVETKVFRFKPALRPTLRDVAAYASRLYFVSAWFEGEFARAIPGMGAKMRRLPNIVRNITPGIATQPAGNDFVAVLNLDTRKRKGLRWLLDGFALAQKAEPAMRLDIVGGGSAESIDAARAMIDSRGLCDVVRLVGPLDNEELLARLPGYRGLVLPSLNETFGMVYIEALFSGIPIVYTAGTGIDGYLDGIDVGVAVPPRDAEAIGAAILDLWRRTDQLRAHIAASAPRLFEAFDPVPMLARYRADVDAATGG